MTDTLLSIDQQRFLLKLARDAVIHRLKTQKSLKYEAQQGSLQEKLGAFVTLKAKGKLRGCVGYPLPREPLFQTIIDAAEMAAFEDSRFQPVTLDEMPDMRIEISVLSLPRKIENPDQVEVGKHGIIVSQGYHRGLLLPQVPVEYNWDRETFLRHGCLKAGLKENAWRHSAELEVFTAQVFSEETA